MTIAHTISTERLVHVLQSLALSQRTGRLYIEHISEQGSQKGEIFFERGNTAFARTEQESGETALLHMMNWNSVRYAFFADVQFPSTITDGCRVSQYKPRKRLIPIETEETVQIPSLGTSVIAKDQRSNTGPMRPVEMEETVHTPTFGIPAIAKGVKPPGHIPTTPLLQTVGSWLRGRERPVSIPQLSVYAIFRVLPTATSHNILNQLERRDRVVLLLLNGKRTLRRVAGLVHRSEVDVARILVHFLKQGYIEYIGEEKFAF